MEADFWHERWDKGETAFHEGRPNRLLTKHVEALRLGEGARVFLPLCGKTIDIHWLLDRGFHLVGIDLSAVAIGQLFADLGIEPTIGQDGELTRYSAPKIEIFVGDVFALTAEQLGPVDAIYDRAALVALPAEMRSRYAAHLADITGATRQLLLSFDYDQRLFDGPPFSVDAAEIERCYGARYQTELLEQGRIPGGLKRHAEVDEAAWLLTARD
ncbi:thiopurine S-methyltransferase [Fulvimarina sp. MAC3]|uniref:thiopurine S-methyltransferase n=1 Tax=Fulvimarina sp. MAC3 TaxID=3148887 RepID=UPI0031FD1B33